ncbi:MAG: aminodeoxychorismate/anthranilate synthase component II [Chloroflexi bacterium]|nr:aminodeoxychorismate/anthranilate synthase component II [Chloroflexota bacterium]MCY3697947.1 aminodeoxychorismate/anthranilate synthase component II [Chloroflexota bacterium]MXX30709.1 aminodeoxychorismate/anthranilate synthase component II [Chloroflexota bacterium]MXX81027.1 aminodeoxychorismate/anthranilate synthase component II [Chloroflexota bacterium]MYB22204.1 aminodeoxychorismate/anthranilate synthase component II [Chloroflexota bacterium]
MAVDTLLIDNYDSFTYNLYQYLCELGADVVVHRNDQITLDEIESLEPRRIVISPGPKTPKEAGVSVPVLQRFSPTIPTLGVCLGHQAIGDAFGATVGPAGEIRHGKVSSIEHDGSGVFAGLPNPIEATRYHSLIVEPDTLPDEIVPTAWCERIDGSGRILMGMRHIEYPIEGVQFHPESIRTKTGHAILQNFLDQSEAFTRD